MVKSWIVHKYTTLHSYSKRIVQSHNRLHEQKSVSRSNKLYFRTFVVCQLPANTWRPLFSRAVVWSILISLTKNLLFPTKRNVLQQILKGQQQHIHNIKIKIYLIIFMNIERAYFRPSRANKLKSFKIEKFDCPVCRTCFIVQGESEWLTDALRNSW